MKKSDIGMWLAIGLCVLLCAGCSWLRPSTPTPVATHTALPPLATASPSPTALQPSATASPSPTALLPSATPSPMHTPLEPTPTFTHTPEAQPSMTPVPGPTVTLRIGWLGVPQALDPAADRPSKADTVLALIYDRLIYRTLDNNYAPALASRWASPDGGRTWVFHLQPNVKTHAGQPFTSEDVAFALRLYQSHFKLRYYGGYTATLQSIEATGPTTLTITMTQPVGNIEAFVHWIPLLPKSSFELGEFAQGKRIGSGPFILQEYEPGQQITLTANPGYWMGAPKVGGIVFRNYANANQLADALKAGDVDVITDVPPSLIATLKSDPRIQVVTGPQVHFRGLLLNVSNKAQSTGHPALKDKQVRLAITHAIDKQQLIDRVLLGRGMPGLSIIPPVLGKWFNAGIQDVPFDLSKAQQILDSAGYKDSNGDGVREMPAGGKSLSFRLFIPSDSATASQEADLLAGWLGQIGIKVTLQTMSANALAAAGCPACNYDMVLWEQDGGPDPGFLLSTWTTVQIEAGLNPTGYSNPAYDALYFQQANTIDQEQRGVIVRQMQQMVFDDRPCIVLYYDLAVQAFRKDRFQNWLFVPNGVLSLLDERSLLQVAPVLP